MFMFLFLCSIPNNKSLRMTHMLYVFFQQTFLLETPTSFKFISMMNMLRGLLLTLSSTTTLNVWSLHKLVIVPYDRRNRPSSIFRIYRYTLLGS